MAWTFIYAASHQVFDPHFTIVGFLKSTKTFHDVYAPLTNPSIAPVLGFLVAYGHLAIGLSLLFGLLVRVSSLCGIALLLTYWTAHMDWPFIENTNNFIVDYHIVYSVVMAYLFVNHAGQVWGLDGIIKNWPWFERHPTAKALVA